MTAPSKEMTLPELRKFARDGGQLFVQNKTPFKQTFHEAMGDKRVDFELDPAGEPDSITFLPALALDMRGLQKLWMRGSIAISSDPEMEDQILLMNAKAIGLSDAQLQSRLNMQTEPANNKDQLEKPCLDCGIRDPRTSVITRGRVVQSRRQDKDGMPPLCPDHLDQANQWVPRLVQVGAGETKWEFDRIQLMPNG